MWWDKNKNKISNDKASFQQLKTNFKVVFRSYENKPQACERRDKAAFSRLFFRDKKRTPDESRDSRKRINCEFPFENDKIYASETSNYKQVTQGMFVRENVCLQIFLKVT